MDTRPLTPAMRRALVLLSGRKPTTTGANWITASTHRALVARGLTRYKGRAQSLYDGVALTDEGERQAAGIDPGDV